MRRNRIVVLVCAVAGTSVCAHAQKVLTYRGGAIGPDRVEHRSQPLTRIVRYADVMPLSEEARDAAEQYGEAADPDQTIVVGKGRYWFRVSPWVPVHHLHGKHIEQQRLDWLRRHGFVGGIKTVTNPGIQPDATMGAEEVAIDGSVVVSPADDSVSQPEMEASEKKTIEPRARFRIPESATRETPTFRV